MFMKGREEGRPPFSACVGIESRANMIGCGGIKTASVH